MMKNAPTYVYLVVAAEDAESVDFTDVSVYLTRAEAELAADDLEEYLGAPGLVHIRETAIG